MCERDNRRITRMESDAGITILADRWEGKRLHRPNDIVGHSNVSLYFTNPSDELIPRIGKLLSRESTLSHPTASQLQ
jgi:sugar lactone lactonase YvrE